MLSPGTSAPRVREKERKNGALKCWDFLVHRLLGRTFPCADASNSSAHIGAKSPFLRVQRSLMLVRCFRSAEVKLGPSRAHTYAYIVGYWGFYIQERETSPRSDNLSARARVRLILQSGRAISLCSTCRTADACRRFRAHRGGGMPRGCVFAATKSFTLSRRGLALLSPFTVLTAIARREPSSRPRTREVSPGVPTQWQRSKLCPSRTLAFPHRSLWWAGYKKRLSALRRRTSSPVFGGAPFRDADAVTVPRVRRYHQMEAAIGWLQKNSGRSQEGRES